MENKLSDDDLMKIKVKKNINLSPKNNKTL